MNEAGAVKSHYKRRSNFSQIPLSTRAPDDQFDCFAIPIHTVLHFYFEPLHIYFKLKFPPHSCSFFIYISGYIVPDKDVPYTNMDANIPDTSDRNT